MAVAWRRLAVAWLAGQTVRLPPALAEYCFARLTEGPAEDPPGGPARHAAQGPAAERPESFFGGPPDGMLRGLTQRLPHGLADHLTEHPGAALAKYPAQGRLGTSGRLRRKRLAIRPHGHR